jgi:Transposase DDE domain
MKTSDGSFHQCFNGQAVVDSQTQVIVAAELSDQAPDAEQLEPALDQLQENLDAVDAELPEGAALTADAGYFSEENITITAAHGLDPFIATGRYERSEPQEPAPRGPIPKNATPKQRMARKLKTKGRAHRLRQAQGDRRAGVRPDAHRPRRPTATVTRRTRRPRPMALPLRDPQPAQAPPRRRTCAHPGSLNPGTGPPDQRDTPPLDHHNPQNAQPGW